MIKLPSVGCYACFGFLQRTWNEFCLWAKKEGESGRKIGSAFDSYNMLPLSLCLKVFSSGNLPMCDKLNELQPIHTRQFCYNKQNWFCLFAQLAYFSLPKQTNRIHFFRGRNRTHDPPHVCIIYTRSLIWYKCLEGDWLYSRPKWASPIRIQLYDVRILVLVRANRLFLSYDPR
jgi:hypothetical protein